GVGFAVGFGVGFGVETGSSVASGEGSVSDTISLSFSLALSCGCEFSISWLLSEDTEDSSKRSPFSSSEVQEVSSINTHRPDRTRLTIPVAFIIQILLSKQSTCFCLHYTPHSIKSNHIRPILSSFQNLFSIKFSNFKPIFI